MKKKFLLLVFMAVLSMLITGCVTKYEVGLEKQIRNLDEEMKKLLEKNKVIINGSIEQLAQGVTAAQMFRIQMVSKEAAKMGVEVILKIATQYGGCFVEGFDKCVHVYADNHSLIFIPTSTSKKWGNTTLSIFFEFFFGGGGPFLKHLPQLVFIIIYFLFLCLTLWVHYTRPGNRQC